MVNWYVREVVTQERLVDMRRAAGQQRQVLAALAGRQGSSEQALGAAAERDSGLIVGLGDRLLAWSRRQQPADKGI